MAQHREIECWLSDMDGVLVHENHAVPGAAELIAQWIDEKFDLRPGAIVEQLDLRRPIYQKTAAYGHFGRTDPDFTWENTDIGREAAGRIAASG